jgi:hypothetical protein
MSGAASGPGGTDVTGGVGGTTFGALSSIGSDLSVSVSFNIASELLSAANDEQLSEDELIGLVLGFTIVFSALQARLASELNKRKFKVAADAKASARSQVRKLRDRLLDSDKEPVSTDPTTRLALLEQLNEQFEEPFVNEAARDALDKLSDRRSMLDFLYLLVSICQRITVAISVQLLAASVKAQQPSRLVRTVSLIGLATFFVFVESLTNRTVV